MSDIFRTSVRGVSKYQTAVQCAQEGDHCQLQPEPTNMYDQNAIQVLLPDGQPIGYIPREQNTSLLAALAAGCTITCTITGTGIPNRSDIIGVGLQLEIEYPPEA